MKKKDMRKRIAELEHLVHTQAAEIDLIGGLVRGATAQLLVEAGILPEQTCEINRIWVEETHAEAAGD